MMCLDETTLQDFADGVLEGIAHADAEAHLARCETCNRSLANARAVKFGLASLPRELDPERDLFPALRKRLEQRPRRNRVKLAALALAAGLAAALFLHGRPQNGPAREPDFRPQMHVAEKTYQRALDDLIREVDKRRGELDPATLAIIDRNLHVIDEAIRASRDALENDPSNPETAMLVASAYESKLDLLQLLERTHR